MPVNARQSAQDLRRRLSHTGEKPQVTRLRRKLRDPFAEALFVLGPHPADAHRGAVIELRLDDHECLDAVAKLAAV
jgi:hypothetical protein